MKFIFLFCKYNQINFFSKISEVTLKIKATKNVTILSDDFFQRYKPYEIYINDSRYDNITNHYDFNDSGNITIKIKWNNTINNTESMFRSCDKIIKIDLSNFNTSLVSNMSRMFYNCSSLISLNLSNFNTSNVKEMIRMFVRCKSLSSLDLSNFDTSQVTDMYSMFYECLNLNILNISNFKTSNVKCMLRMFYY